jgi:hypothetical protein
MGRLRLARRQRGAVVHRPEELRQADLLAVQRRVRLRPAADLAAHRPAADLEWVHRRPEQVVRNLALPRARSRMSSSPRLPATA